MEELKQRLVNCQVGESFNADLEESQWTFQFKDEMSVCAGKFAIVPLDLHVEAIESLQQNEWVSVEDGLPNHGELVLIYRDIEAIDIYACHWDEEQARYLKMNAITHWKPIIKPKE